MKACLTIILYLSAYCLLNAQKIRENRFQSRYTYIFRLDSTQARRAYQGYKPDSSFYLTHKVDSFISDSGYNYPKLPWGVYLSVRAVNTSVHYNTFHQKPFRNEAWGLNNRNFITLKDLNNKIISDAKVSLMDGSICPFAKGMGGYELPKSKVPVLIKMEYNGTWDYVFVNPQYVAAQKPQKYYPDYSHTTIAPGYLVFNKPRFKIFDTLKYKAFLLNDNGTAMKQRLKLFLSGHGHDKFLGYITARTPGAYFGQFEIPDTFLADKPYALIFKNLANQVVKSNSFYVENYELKPNRYSLKGPKPLNLVGDELQVIVGAVDANNLPVMDAYIQMDVRISQVYKYLTDRQFIPDKWFRESYYHFEGMADPSGYTVIRIPDSLFRHFDAAYEITVHVRDQDNNTKDMSAGFQYMNRLYTYNVQYRGDSLVVESRYKTRLHKTDMVLETFSAGKSHKKTITTPYSEKINLQANAYNLYLRDSLVFSYAAPSDYPSHTYFRGNRSADSVHIELVNPGGLHVYYEIYRHNVKIHEGNGTSMQFAVADVSDKSYHVIWTYNYMGESKANLKVQSFHLYETRLNVLIRQPEDIYPGQKVDVAIKVTDQHNRGVGDVNLTAYAVNSQFENIPVPDVPYMGLTRGVYPVNTLYPMTYLPDLNRTHALQKYHLQILNLLDNEVYALFYGKGGKSVVKMPIRAKQPELSAYVYRQGALQNIVYIKVDDELVYHQYHVPHHAYSFPVQKGIHKISVRTFDRILTYDKLLVGDSMKYIIGFNLDSLTYVKDTTKYLSGRLKAYEKEEFLAHTLFLSIKIPHDSVVVMQDNRKHMMRSGWNNGIPYIRIDNDYYRAIGPVNHDDMMRLKLGYRYEHEFTFERGKAYIVFENEIKEIPLRENLKEYNLVSNNILNSWAYNLQSFGQHWYIDMADTVKPYYPVSMKEPEGKDRERPQVAQKQYSPSNNGSYRQGRIALVNHHNKEIKYSWLIHKGDSRMSVINAHQRHEQVYYQTGLYDLLLFTDSAVAVYKDLYLTVEGTFVLFNHKSHFGKMAYRDLYAYESIIEELTRKPFRPFLDTPMLIKPIEIIKKNYTMGKAKLSGISADARFGTPIDYTQLYLELDGYFKYGATTNEDGRFEMSNIPPGNYMLKIRAVNYRYQVVYNLKLEAGKELVIRLNLMHREDEVVYAGDTVLMANGYRWDFGEDRNASPAEEVFFSSTPNMTIKDVSKTGMRNVYVSSASGVTLSAEGRGARAGEMNVWVDRVSAGKYDKEKQEEELYIDRDYANVDVGTMSEKLEAMAQMTQANRLRDKFRDYGYWMPNLITDKDGMAYFTVTFPDNLTSWQTMVPAMNGKRQSGMSTMVTRAFKPLSAAMAAPFFLTEGDKIILKGRVMNYTGKGQEINMRFMLNGKEVTKRNTIVNGFFIDSLMVDVPKGADSVSSAFIFDMQNGYTDGEERDIAVRPNGILISSSRQVLLKTDTTVGIRIPGDVKAARILVHNSEVERLMEEIEGLKNYGYGCVEQTTSKLRALLAEKALKTSLGLPFTEDRMVRKMINRLNSLKNSEGTWSWWGGYGEEDRLSAYVMKALNDARLAGYSNNVYIRAAKRLENRVPYMPAGERLYTLNALFDMDRKLAYDSLIKHIKMDDLDDNQKILYVALLQKLKRKYELSDITQLVNYAPGGGIYFGGNTMRYYDDMSSTTLVAYDILSKDEGGKEYLPYMRDYFYSSHYPRHTFALAEMISIGTREALKKKQSGELTGEVMINGYKLEPKDYPFKNRIKPGDSITISHKGPMAYATVVTSRLETNPVPDHTYFYITSTLGGQNEQIKLAPGKPVEMRINITVFKTSEHIMMEIPVPAGFSYYSKPAASGNETNREYFYDKTSIFCKSLAPGNYSFSVMLVPKFSGVFNLPPAKIELMYYPEIHNNVIVKTVTVE